MSLIRAGMSSGRPVVPILRFLQRNRMILKASAAGRFEQELIPVPSLAVRMLSRQLRILAKEDAPTE